MAQKQIKDIAASVRAKLFNLSKAQKTEFDSVLLQYFQERLLYRLSISPYKDNFILKGALLFLSLDMPRTRPTKDIDFLGVSTENSPQSIKKIFSEIAAIPEDDGVIFDPRSISAQKIQEEEQYEGVRVFLTGKLGSARKKVQIDVGFGDIIVEGPIKAKFPVLIDMPVPVIKAYSKISALAEKLEAIAHRGMTTSRLKDFFDILYLATHSDFEMKALKNAIAKTFSKRDTKRSNIGLIFEKDFKESKEKQSQWEAFLRRNRIDLQIRFAEGVEQIGPFVKPLYDQSIEGNLSWNKEEWTWERK
jgi:predicted nucleotidyltransferase component of viral defense system